MLIFIVCLDCFVSPNDLLQLSNLNAFQNVYLYIMNKCIHLGSRFKTNEYDME